MQSLCRGLYTFFNFLHVHKHTFSHNPLCSIQRWRWKVLRKPRFALQRAVWADGGFPRRAAAVMKGAFLELKLLWNGLCCPTNICSALKAVRQQAWRRKRRRRWAGVGWGGPITLYIESKCLITFACSHREQGQPPSWWLHIFFSVCCLNCWTFHIPANFKCLHRACLSEGLENLVCIVPLVASNPANIVLRLTLSLLFLFLVQRIN